MKSMFNQYLKTKVNINVNDCIKYIQKNFKNKDCYKEAERVFGSYTYKQAMGAIAQDLLKNEVKKNNQ